MPFETPFPEILFDGTIDVSAHEHPTPEGTLAPPITIIRTDQSWAVNVHWDVSGAVLNFIHGWWHLHAMLETLGPGDDIDLRDPVAEEHLIRLNPPNGHYFVHLDVPAGRVPAPDAGRLYKLVVSLTYRTLAGSDGVGPPGEMAAYVEGPALQFYNAGP